MFKAQHLPGLGRALFAPALAIGLIVGLAVGSASAWTRQAYDAHTATPRAGSQGQYGAMTDEHLRKLMHHLMETVDPHQRSRLVEIAERARPELERFEQRARQARAPRRDILLADVVDTQALDRVRAAEMQVVQERARRVDQLLVEVASVLTPAQRAAMKSDMQSPAH
ncbi:Spy/CpxP family protein refolding chaperone [Lysobacter korlensis]|uniref:Spy/CpxP family protein refolding chaperone n=1 Tax=Lysobacter korlensis TaxID=553636 RepID=A0ABV6RRN8_9GAMM